MDGPGAAAPATNTDGTNGDDTYIGTFTSASGDFIDGKLGNDTLKLVGNGTAVVSLTSVERVEGNAQGGAGTINAAGSTGIQTLASVGSANNMTFSGLAALVDTVEVKNTTAGDVTVTYNAAAVAGVTDSQKITVDSSVAGSVTINGIETFAVTATGANSLSSLVSDKLKTVTVDGAGSLTVTNSLADTVTSFDASAAVGKVSVGFTSGADVSVKTGVGDDRVNMNDGLTSKDSIDLGEGTNTLVLSNTDISAATNDALKGVNAAKGVQVLEFAGASSKLSQTTLTNADITKFVFNTGGADEVLGAKTTLFAFGKSNEGDATFALAGTNTTLNLALEAQAKTDTLTFDDADIGTLNTGGALTINISSTGANDAVIDLAAPVDNTVNNIGTLTAAANATVNLTGDAATHIGGSTNGVNLQAGAFTGTLVAQGSASDDILVGGSGKTVFIGANGIDNIDISKSGAGDIIDLQGIVALANRDVITGFQAGSSGDLVRIADAQTTKAGTSVAWQEVTSNSGIVNFNTAANDVLEIGFNIAGSGLADAANSGDNLLTAVGTLNVSANGDVGYVVAYQGGNAYLYHANAGGDSVVDAGELALVGVFNGVALGAFDAANFQIV